MFKEELIFLDHNFDSSDEVIKYSFKQLRRLDYVKEEYLDSILARESEFPTGLMTHVGINIAIPHTDSDLAIKEAIVFIRNKKDVVFQHMIDPEEEVPTKLIFNIVVKDPKNQVSFLTKLMKMFQNEILLEFLLTETDKEKIIQTLKNFLI
ncbi:hypothetical protein A9Q68_09085 [Streptococcus bovimastitidis]|uniref:PTS EIIA type-2 domain-containing protein n=1 Tax=Streptococcus bovimastitidis TaxID=1856638 RepID=A0A1L8MKN0_9STRE|nr:PTS sugar transporter subunit IIA [Streptococcus bovimastitidis]OJF71340.1 hypothetical protein A9Q68_09085 [Streptococcus bovimastitidis]